jgi:hypothetical protein
LHGVSSRGSSLSSLTQIECAVDDLNVEQGHLGIAQLAMKLLMKTHDRLFVITKGQM